MRALSIHRVVPTLLFFLLLPASVIGFGLTTSVPVADQPSSEPQRLPITTSHPEALALFEHGIVNYENYHLDEAVADWRKAVQLDPKFAMAEVWISLVTNDPKEERDAESGAKKYAALASVPEQLMIRWITSVQDNDYISGISAMNDLLAQYPRDKHLNYAAGRWLLQRQQYQKAQNAVERALAVDPAYPPALNILGYAYARTGQFEKAFAAMEKYTTVLPNEANPQDSYAEVFEIAGDFERAVEHYQAALKIDPKFYPSQGGLADTYSLMGRQEAARVEFAKAIEMSPNEAAKTDYRLRAALTYVREKKFADADRAYTEAATLAHASGLWIWEARAHRAVAMYQPDLTLAMKHLYQAEAALQKRLGTADASFTEEFVKILRVRVDRHAEAHNLALAQVALTRLKQMAKGGSNTVQQTYQAATGALLLAEKKYAEAIPHLEEDSFNALSMKKLLDAYTHTGASEEAQSIKRRLLAMNVATIEQALAVPALRAEAQTKSAK